MIAGRAVTRELGGKQGRAVLGALILSRPRGLRRDELIDVLWPGAAPKSPKRVLDSVLSRLRGVLGPDAITGRDYLCISLGPDAVVDVAIPAQAVDSAEGALAAKDFGTAREAAHTGLDALAGPLLPGLEGPWLEPHRAHLAELTPRLLRIAVRAGLALGGPALDRALEDAKRLVADNPFSESATGLLMDVHEARGDIAEALRTYDELRNLLRDEVGQPPSKALVERHRQLVAITDEPPAPEVSISDDRARFVGREAELAWLRREWQGLKPGRWPLVVVEGEAGIGKSRLAERFAGELDARSVLHGRCEEDPIVPFQPFVEAFTHRDALTAVAYDEEVHALAPLMPDRALPPGQAAGEAPEMLRWVMFEAVARRLERWTRVRPLLFVLDDLQWADQPTVKLLRHLARCQHPMRLLVVATFRIEDENVTRPCMELLDDLRRGERLHRHRLGGLTLEETGELAAGRLEAATADFAPRLWEKTDGHPLYIEETLRWVSESDASGPPSASLLDRDEAPDGVKSVVARRLKRMDGEAAQTLATGAAIGQEFDVRLVAAVRGRDVASVLFALERAPTEGLIAEREPYRYRFSHAVVRDAVYAHLTATMRAHSHQRIADLLEAEDARPGQAAEIAHHLLRAHADPLRIVGFLRRAAEEAWQSYALEEAAAHYERAALLIGARGPEFEQERCTLVLARAASLARAGMSHDAQPLFHEVAESARARGDPDQLAMAALGLGERFWEANVDARNDRNYRRRLREALAMLPEGDSPARARLLARLAAQLAFLYDEEDEDPVALSAEAVDMARRLGDPSTLSTALMARHAALLHVQYAEERLALIDYVLERASGVPGATAEARLWRIYDLCELGRMDEARADAQRLNAFARGLPLPLVRHVAIGWESLFTELEGDVAATERLATEFLRLGERAQLYDARSTYVAKLYALYRWLGRLDELREDIEALAAGVIAKSAWNATLALHRALTGDPDGGRAGARALVADLSRIPRDFFWLSAVTVTAECVSVLGDAEPAEPLYAALTPYADRHTTHSFGASWGSVERPLGLLAALAGRTHAAAGHFQRALAANRAIDAPVLVAVTQCDYGELLARLGDRAQARELGADAERTARQCGLPVLAERAVRLAAEPSPDVVA